jgi:hypothetical protein
MTKKVKAEGIKKAREILYFMKLGDVQFFHVCFQEVKADWLLMDIAIKSFQRIINKNNKNVAITFFSDENNNLIWETWIPNEISASYNIKLLEWCEVFNNSIGTNNGFVVDGEYYKGEYKNENCFPLKLRDYAIATSINWLTKKEFIKDDEESDDENYAEAAGIEW